MNGVNKVLLVGEVASPPMQKGDGLVKLQVKIQESYVTKDGEERWSVSTLTASVFGRQAMAAASLRVGEGVCIEGKLKNSSYMPRDGGEKKWTLDIVANSLKRLNHVPPGGQGEF